MADYERNERYWTRDGRHVVLAGQTAGVFVVSEIYDEDEDGEIWTTDPFVVRELLTDPPEKRAADELQQLRAEIAEAREELSALRTAARTQNREYDELVERLAKRHRVLKRVEEFLDGKVTHIVRYDYGDIKITPLASLERNDDYDRCPDKLRLIVLHGMANGDIEWHWNEYRDGSGSWRAFVPCASKEEAHRVAKEVAQRAVDEVRGNEYRLLRALREAKRVGVALSSADEELLRKDALASAKEAREKAVNESNAAGLRVSELDVKIAALEAKGASNG